MIRLDDPQVARDLERLERALVRIAVAWARSHPSEPPDQPSARRKQSNARSVAGVQRASRDSQRTL
jgi:hypothetical protein